MKFNKGALVIPRDAQYPDGVLAVDGYDTTGRMMAHPMGGGPQFFIGDDQAAKLRPVTAEEMEGRRWRRARFALEGVDEVFEGWTCGHRWNGWAVPTFEAAVARKVAAACDLRFDEERDTFVGGTEGEEEEWAAGEIELVGGTKLKVYDIGGGSWCWDEAEGRGAMGEAQGGAREGRGA